MAGAAKVTIAEVDEIVEIGDLDPEEIVTPCVYVDRVIARPKEYGGEEDDIDEQAQASHDKFIKRGGA